MVVGSRGGLDTSPADWTFLIAGAPEAGEELVDEVLAGTSLFDIPLGLVFLLGAANTPLPLLLPPVLPCRWRLEVRWR